jgi:DnaJ-class molecular chaperone
MLDPYATLEVARTATPDEIKRAFRRLAKELHPDLNPNSPAIARRFRDVAAAYDVLSDEGKRRDYDRQVDAARAAADRQAAWRASTAGANAFDDNFDSFFKPSGRTANQRRERPADAFWRGGDIHQSLRISFVEAALGTRKRIQIADRRVLDVAIPAATLDGQTLRLKGQGTPGMLGTTPGDVLVEIAVEPHPLFSRKDHDIHMALQVTVPEAVLGASVIVPTIHGTVQLHIPKGSNTDTVLRLRGKGVPMADGGAGDQYVTLKVVLPPNDDRDFAKLVEQWAKRRAYTVRAG